MSCTAPNAQQFPHSVKKGIYKARNGHVILSADYPSIEARVAGVKTKDKRILEMFQKPLTAPIYETLDKSRYIIRLIIRAIPSSCCPI